MFTSYAYIFHIYIEPFYYLVFNKFWFSINVQLRDPVGLININCVNNTCPENKATRAFL